MNSLKDRELLIKFGKRLKTIRESKGISQETLGLDIGSFQSTIIRIEQGKSNPKLSTLNAIAKRLGVSLSELMKV